MPLSTWKVSLSHRVARFSPRKSCFRLKTGITHHRCRSRFTTILSNGCGPFVSLFIFSLFRHLFFPLHCMDQSKSHCPHVGLIECMYPPRDDRWCLLIAARLFWSLLPLLGPGLEVLQGVQGGVMGAQWIRHRWLAEGLLEGGLLQLQDETIGLLTLRLPLLGRLSPERRQRKGFIFFFCICNI